MRAETIAAEREAAELERERRDRSSILGAITGNAAFNSVPVRLEQV